MNNIKFKIFTLFSLAVGVITSSHALMGYPNSALTENKMSIAIQNNTFLSNNNRLEIRQKSHAIYQIAMHVVSHYDYLEEVNHEVDHSHGYEPETQKVQPDQDVKRTLNVDEMLQRLKRLSRK